MQFIGNALAKIWSVIAPVLLPFIWKKIEDAYKAYIARREADRRIRDQARKVLEQTEAAQSPKEREEAADETRRNW